MSASPKRTHYLSLHLLEGGWLKQAAQGVKHQQKCAVTDLGLLKRRVTCAGSPSPCSDDNESEAEGGVTGSGFTFCRHREHRGEKWRAPPAVSLPQFGSQTNASPSPTQSSLPRGSCQGRGGRTPTCQHASG
ncbi:hypothetical protein NQZ68_002636 [Dissostichus eleginoides]|nr:hypothetical protein NQZ68_002636 [Dissostichus eleginoides]